MGNSKEFWKVWPTGDAWSSPVIRISESAFFSAKISVDAWAVFYAQVSVGAQGKEPVLLTDKIFPTLEKAQHWVLIFLNRLSDILREAEDGYKED